MNLPEQKSVRGLTWPSNLAILTLFGFLCAGYVTEWEMLRGSPSKSTLVVVPGLPKSPADSLPPRLRYAKLENSRPVDQKVGWRTEFADRRAVIYDAKNASERD